jgi:L-lactate dehydrogenase complex protein LldE
MEKEQIGLFVTCLVDLFRPSIAFNSIKLLEATGHRVVVPTSQVCCGQPSYNSGDLAGTRDIAKHIIEAFADVKYVVAPSGSCAGMLSKHYPALFKDDPDWFSRAQALAGKTFELTAFLVDVCGMDKADGSYTGVVTVHDSCSALRESNIKTQPRQLLESIDTLSIAEHPKAEVCCGFGGTFCVKYPDISNKMVTDKAQDIIDSGADTVVSGDLGCLMNIAGKLKRMGSTVEVRHVAELLAGDVNTPAIGEGTASAE